jgi:hypothetical protein
MTDAQKTKLGYYVCLTKRVQVRRHGPRALFKVTLAAA